MRFHLLLVAFLLSASVAESNRVDNDDLESFIGDKSTSLPDTLKQISEQPVERNKTANSKLFPVQTQLTSRNDFDSVVDEPRDCLDVKAAGYGRSGVYRIYISRYPSPITTDVYCDLTTQNEAWLVFQKRKDGRVDFERTWSEYANGFGSPHGEFWLGNEVLHTLTSLADYKLRVELEDFEGQRRYAEYSTFNIGSSTDYYKLTVSGYSGNAGDDMAGHNGQQFSTKDVDRDTWPNNCATAFRGAWWYNQCHLSNLNGFYWRGSHSSYADGVNWHSFHGYHYSLKATEMKIARKQ